MALIVEMLNPPVQQGTLILTEGHSNFTKRLVKERRRLFRKSGEAKSSTRSFFLSGDILKLKLLALLNALTIVL